MSRCNFIRFDTPKICIADLNKRVQLVKRAIVAPVGQSIYQNNTPLENTYDFELVATLWAAVKNIKGDAILDGVATNDIPTHWFYTRYRTDVTNDNWLILNGYYYRIMQVQNMMEDNTYLQIKCLKTGETTKGAAQI